MRDQKPTPAPRKGNVKRLIGKFEGSSEVTTKPISGMFRARGISEGLASKVNASTEVEAEFMTPKPFK